MASNPPAQCCTVGVKWEGESTGKMETVEGTETYIATPSKPHAGKAVLILTDVIGHTFINAQQLADQFAANGYLTYMPDLFHGDPIPLNRPAGFDLQKWLKGAAGGGEGEGHGVARVEPIVNAAIKHLREKQGITKLAAVGYCFGAKYVVRAQNKSNAGKGVDVGYSAHPSFVDDEELQNIGGPFSIAAAETDEIFPAEKRHRSEGILQKAGHPYQINLYSGVSHGFAVRGEFKDAQQKWAREQAFLQAVQWFDNWL